MSETDNNYAITTVVTGDKYRLMLNAFMDSYNRYENMPQMLVVSEEPDKINHQNIITTNIVDVPLKVNGDFNMSLKRLAFQHAIDRGYEKFIFIDIDRTIEEWDWDTINAVTEQGFGTNWLRRGKHRKGQTEGHKPCKYEAILTGFGNDDYFNYKYPIFGESLNIINSDKQTIQKFIDIWSKCSDFIQNSECTPRHINVEMGIALKLSGMPVYKYKQGIDTDFDGKIFKHYSYGKKSQLLKLSENK